MISQTLGNLDPQSRVIEELATVISDVDQRLQLVKTGLVQAFPHLAPSITKSFGNPTPLQAPTGFPTGVNPSFPFPSATPFAGLLGLQAHLPFAAATTIGQVIPQLLSNPLVLQNPMLLQSILHSLQAPLQIPTGVSGVSPVPGMLNPYAGMQGVPPQMLGIPNPLSAYGFPSYANVGVSGLGWNPQAGVNPFRF